MSSRMSLNDLMLCLSASPAEPASSASLSAVGLVLSAATGERSPSLPLLFLPLPAKLHTKPGGNGRRAF